MVDKNVGILLKSNTHRTERALFRVSFCTLSSAFCMKNCRPRFTLNTAIEEIIFTYKTDRPDALWREHDSFVAIVTSMRHHAPNLNSLVFRNASVYIIKSKVY